MLPHPNGTPFFQSLQTSELFLTWSNEECILESIVLCANMHRCSFEYHTGTHVLVTGLTLLPYTLTRCSQNRLSNVALDDTHCTNGFLAFLTIISTYAFDAIAQRSPIRRIWSTHIPLTFKSVRVFRYKLSYLILFLIYIHTILPCSPLTLW